VCEKEEREGCRMDERGAGSEGEREGEREGRREGEREREREGGGEEGKGEGKRRKQRKRGTERDGMYVPIGRIYRQAYRWVACTDAAPDKSHREGRRGKEKGA
jgi:hypothetical protein